LAERVTQNEIAVGGVDGFEIAKAESSRGRKVPLRLSGVRSRLSNRWTEANIISDTISREISLKHESKFKCGI
jgi:hypothetical protein